MAGKTANGGGIMGLIRSTPEFINQVKAETSKVVWPTRKQTMMTAIMVIIMTTALGLFFLALDSAFNAATQFLLSLI